MIKYCFLFILPFLFSCIQVNNDGSLANKNKEDSIKKSILNKWNSEDEFYSIYHLRNLKVEITNVRPLQSDTSIKLCIPAAFTQLDDGSIDGLFIINGKIVDAKKVNHHLGGGFLIVNDKISIIKTDDGKFLTASCVDSLANLKASFFQQIQLVRDGENLGFHKDQKLFQRRAVAIYENGEIAMIESKSPITLDEFADDLVKMQVQNAIYTDMGSYDEGWARNPENGTIKVLGSNRSETRNQSNWLIFKY
ncbi:MAG TPA: phosphodiester glycosidase family protein [Bacteroidia bacterium]|nr:phosphodiester glycosidase family protein [Bacteroidia bacterium]